MTKVETILAQVDGLLDAAYEVVNGRKPLVMMQIRLKSVLLSILALFMRPMVKILVLCLLNT